MIPFVVSLSNHHSPSTSSGRTGFVIILSTVSYIFPEVAIMSLTRLFCDTDDFCQWFTTEWEKTQIEEGSKKRRRKRSLSHAEIITIIAFYYQSGYKTFKWFYERYACKRLNQEFQTLVSEILPDVLIPLTFFMQSRCGKNDTATLLNWV